MFDDKAGVDRGLLEHGRGLLSGAGQRTGVRDSGALPRRPVARPALAESRLQLEVEAEQIQSGR